MGALSKKVGGDAMTNCHKKELDRYTCTLISTGCGWWTLSINYFRTVYFTIACFDCYRTCMYRYIRHVKIFANFAMHLLSLAKMLLQWPAQLLR